jgi:hypothetical protein
VFREIGTHGIVAGPLHALCDMPNLIRTFWEICLLQKAPQDIPFSRGLFLLVLVAGFLIDNVNLNIALPEVAIASVIMVVSLHTLFLLGSLSVLLTLMGYRARIFQTLTALIGTGIIISLLALPVLLVVSRIASEPGYFGLILLLLNIWSLLVTAHILRHSLSIGFLLAGLLAFGYFMISIKLVDVMLPVSS